MRKNSLALAAFLAVGLASTGASADTVLATAKLDVAVAPATTVSGFTIGGVSFGPATATGLIFVGASFATFTATTSGGDLIGVCPSCASVVVPDTPPDHFGAVVHH